MRVLIIASGGYLDKRIGRILNNNGINGDVVSKLTRDMIQRYNCVIFSHNNDIPNLPKLIETIVLERKILVCYINNTSSIGYYYNVIEDLFFCMMNENTLDFELPFVLKTTTKYIKEISYLDEKVNLLVEDKNVLKQTNKAKRILMSKGLSEEESHKFIQQKSMSLRISKKSLVNLIIENKIDI